MLGFASLEDPDLSAKISEMRDAAVAAVGPDFSTMLLLPDDHIWVQRLHLHGFTSRAKDENARKVLAEATSLPVSGFSIAYGDTDKHGATAVAATTTEVLTEARKFARDNGFNPKSLASRSFFDGFSTRAAFGDAPKPMAFLPRKAEIAVPTPRAAKAPARPKFKFPRIRRDWAIGGAAALLVSAAIAYWSVDPFEQFVRAPNPAQAVADLALPDATLPAPAFAVLMGSATNPHEAPNFNSEPPPKNVILAQNNDAAAPVQVAIAFDAAGVYFANVPLAPLTPSGLGAHLAWTAPATMFLDVPDAEPAIGVAALQKPPVLPNATIAPQDSGIFADLALSTVSTRSVGGLPDAPLALDLQLPLTGGTSDFPYRNGLGDLGAQALADVTNVIADNIAFAPPQLEGLQLASLTSDLATRDSADTLISSPAPQITAPGLRPLARPDAFSIIQPSEAIAALTPATESSLFGPPWPQAVATPEPYPVTEFNPADPSQIRPRPRAGVPIIPLALGPLFGPEAQPQIAALSAGAVEFDPNNPSHLRPVLRTAEMEAKAAAASVQASIVALNLPASATLDVGLGWQEYNADNPVHIRPKVRPASLQQLAEEGDLAPTLLALKTSTRPTARPSGIAAIILARGEELAAAQAAAAEAEARAQSVAEATALAMAESQPITDTSADADLAALDDAEPDSNVQVASIPTSNDVAEAATIEGGLVKSEISLIGVYGTETKRRALVRLSSGRYERVTVGDSVAGWQVSAISKDAIRIVRGGRDAILRMPN